MSEKRRDFAQVDVFANTPYLGNPVAVVVEAAGMTDDEMATLARWTNLSETTFILPPTDPAADYRLRIFTPGGELPFAGHPTLGSAHAWLENGGKAKKAGHLVQECGVGLVTLTSTLDENGRTQLSFQAPATVNSGEIPAEVLHEIIDALGIQKSDIVAHQVVDNGPGWVCVQLASAEMVLALDPQFKDDSTLMLGLVGAHPEGSEASFELRAFAPKINVYEDPVTGSLNASVAQWLYRSGQAKGQYIASQGTRVGRQGLIELTQDLDGEVWVGGSTITCIRGSIEI
jgi:PhzF family phenazine biosynthesis protein